MQIITLNGTDFHIAETWQEVDSKKLPSILSLLYVHPENGTTYLEVLRILLDFSPKKWRKLIAHFYSNNRSIQDIEETTTTFQAILQKVSWMWKGDLTRRPFEGFNVNGQCWLVFEEGFKSMSFGELSNAHINAQAFIKQLVVGEERLNVLAATLCRPARKGDFDTDPNWNGDPRQNYNEHIARHRAEMLEGSFLNEKILVLMYFLGTLKEFFSYYDLFESDTSGPAPQEDYPGQSMIKNQHLLSEKHIFGGMEATKLANVHEVFQFLEEHKKDIKHQNEQIKKQNESNQ